MLCRRLRLLPQNAAVRCVHAARVQSGANVLKECSRVGMRLNLLVGAENDLAQLFVVASGCQQVAEREKLLVRLFIRHIKHFFEHFRAEQLALVFVHQAKVGRDAEHRRLLSRERQAQRVHSRDLRSVHQEQLPPQTRIPRVRGYRCTESRADSLAHFGCRCVGKGNQQQAVDIDWIVLVRQPPEHALGQYCCLARAGCRRNQQCSAAVVDRNLLIRCPLRHCRSLLTAARIPRP